MNESVRFHNVTKKYKMHSKNSEKLKDILYPGGFGEDFYALRNLTFEAQKGDVIGIVGVNGSGKSTMSNLIAGITPPTIGSIDIKGKVALIAIAAGLNNQLSGRENIELKCLMMGMSKAQIEKLTPEIIDFADIGKFIDMPVKKYSSGMKSRLGFAISVSINPDVLVIDEALSVGDQTFADKCLNRMNEFKEQGKTIFFVSHSLGQVKKFCTKDLWLEYGEIRDYGPIEEVMPKYESFLKEYKEMSKEEQQNFKKEAMEKQKAMADKNAAEGKKFLDDNKKKEGVKTTASGLQYKVMKEGNGPQPKAADTVTVDYKGTLIDGTEFDSSYKRGQPATFPLNGVIKGWTEGLQLMKTGGKYQFFIPADLAYGQRQMGPDIPPNSTLIFEVELKNVQTAPPETSPAAGTSPTPKDKK